MKLKIIILVWIILWVNFVARDFYKHGYLARYKILAGSDRKGKYSHTYGKRFYEFLRFTKDSIPRGARYGFVGIENLSLDLRRGIYYLYPCLNTKNPDYLLVYDTKGFEKNGFHIYAELDSARFILEKD